MARQARTNETMRRCPRRASGDPPAARSRRCCRFHCRHCCRFHCHRNGPRSRLTGHCHALDLARAKAQVGKGSDRRFVENRRRIAAEHFDSLDRTADAQEHPQQHPATASRAPLSIRELQSWRVLQDRRHRQLGTREIPASQRRVHHPRLQQVGRDIGCQPTLAPRRDQRRRLRRVRGARRGRATFRPRHMLRGRWRRPAGQRLPLTKRARRVAAKADAARPDAASPTVSGIRNGTADTSRCSHSDTSSAQSSLSRRRCAAEVPERTAVERVTVCKDDAEPGGRRILPPTTAAAPPLIRHKRRTSSATCPGAPLVYHSISRRHAPNDDCPCPSGQGGSCEMKCRLRRPPRLRLPFPRPAAGKRHQGMP
jgi:hypothetical protein